MVGDSTSKDDIERLTNGNEIDLVVTDPPYNVDITGGGDKKLKIANDNMENDEFQKFLENAFNAMASQLKRGGELLRMVRIENTCKLRDSTQCCRFTSKRTDNLV
jgi:DNA modification methylase